MLYSKLTQALWYMQVRSLRKRMVQKALALMENIDNAKSGMLRSVMDSHPTDDHSELSAAESDSERASNSSPEMDDIKPSTEEHGDVSHVGAQHLTDAVNATTVGEA